MIIGVIANTKIVLASDTRCMIGNPGNYLAYHDQARKIVILNQPQIACAVACDIKKTFGGTSIIDISKRSLSDINYRQSVSLSEIHVKFQEKIYEDLLYAGEKYYYKSILAKFDNDNPCLSYGNLSNGTIFKSKGIFSYPPLQNELYENEKPTDEQAVQFVKDKIKEKSKRHVEIGSDIEIIYLTSTTIDWIQKQNWLPLPTKPQKLYDEWKKDHSILKQLNKEQKFEEWEQELEKWFKQRCENK